MREKGATRDRGRVAFVRAAAIALALAAAWVIAGAVRTDEPNRPFAAVFLRALAMTARCRSGSSGR